MSDPNIAPPGQLWVCGQCGRTQRSRFGDGRTGQYARGWDVSCYLNALLCYEPTKLGPDGVANDVQTVHPPDRGLEPLKRLLVARDIQAQLRGSGGA